MKGDGRVFKPRKGGLELPFWHIAYWGPTPEGIWTEIRESARTTDEGKARRILQHRLREIENHRAGLQRFSSPQRERATCGELFDALEANYALRELKSRRSAKYHIAHLRKFFGGYRATAVTPTLIQRYVELRKKVGAAAATIDRETEKLARAFALAIEQHRLAETYRLRVPRLVKENSNARSGFFERGEFEVVLTNLPDSDVREFLSWAYFTGMRRGEIASLTWEGFDRETWTLRLHARDAKSGHGRVFALSGAWREIIERRIAARVLRCPFIFHRRGRRMGDFTPMWVRACKAAGVAGRRVHDLRRTAVRNLMRSGVSQTVSKAISGHRTDSMFRRYDITTESDLREAADRLTSYVGSLPKAPSVRPIERLGENSETAISRAPKPSVFSGNLAPQVGFEPTTLRLTAGCSTVELLRKRSTESVTLTAEWSPVNLRGAETRDS